MGKGRNLRRGVFSEGYEDAGPGLNIPALLILGGGGVEGIRRQLKKDIRRFTEEMDALDRMMRTDNVLRLRFALAQSIVALRKPIPSRASPSKAAPR